jgi:hypothetical protein
MTAQNPTEQLIKLTFFTATVMRLNNYVLGRHKSHSQTMIHRTLHFGSSSDSMTSRSQSTRIYSANPTKHMVSNEPLERERMDLPLIRDHRPQSF